MPAWAEDSHCGVGKTVHRVEPGCSPSVSERPCGPSYSTVYAPDATMRRSVSRRSTVGRGGGPLRLVHLELGRLELSAHAAHRTSEDADFIPSFRDRQALTRGAPGDGDGFSFESREGDGHVPPHRVQEQTANAEKDEHSPAPKASQCLDLLLVGQKGRLR